MTCSSNLDIASFICDSQAKSDFRIFRGYKKKKNNM